MPVNVVEDNVGGFADVDAVVDNVNRDGNAVVVDKADDKLEDEAIDAEVSVVVVRI